jgi:hypothetical protein
VVANDFEEGLLVGLLIGEGHFGGDGRQPHVTLRMHVRHEDLFAWLLSTFPGGKLYGPYNHDGRHYLQWMARGAHLRDVLLPVLEARLAPGIDSYATARYEEMKARYGRRLGLADVAGPTSAMGPADVPRATDLTEVAEPAGLPAQPSSPEGPPGRRTAPARERGESQQEQSLGKGRASSVAGLFDQIRRETTG